MWKDFKAFVSRGNVIDLAVAVVMGAAFGKIVNTFVDGVLMPPLGLLLRNVDFSSLFWVLDTSKGVPASLAEAKAKGIPVLAYGAFINDVISFFIVAVAVFLMVRALNHLRAKEQAQQKACPYCLTTVPLQATRCPSCTSDLKAA